MKNVYRSCKTFASVFLLLLVAAITAFAQQKVVTGTIKDPQGIGMPGVNVIRKGTTVGTSTDAAGNFRLEASETDVLVFSFIGYASKEVAVGAQTVIDVTLEEDLKALEEVVVYGYGETRKADLTTAQVSLSAKELDRTVNTTLEQAFQGRAAGVFVTQNTGAPGGGVSVTIRGINSINGTNEPLYVVDGIQMEVTLNTSGLNPLSTLNPSDIESIDFLQGPSATAIYGSRGTNGVVLITTKRGKNGDMKISYGYTYSLQTTPKRLDVMNMRQYAQMENEYKAIAGGQVREDFMDPSILGAGTDWQNELFDNAAMHKHQLSLSGGTERSTYYLSGERMLQDGIALGSGFKRSSVRLNVDNKLRDWVSIGANVNYAQTNTKLSTNDMNQENLIVNSIRLGPHIPVRNIDGSFAGGNPSNSSSEQFAPVNPVGIASLSTNDRTDQRLLGGLNVTFKIIDGLELRSNFSTDMNFANQTYYLPTYSFGWQGNGTAKLETRHNFNNYWVWNQTLTYVKQFGKHRVNAMVTHEAQESNWENLMASRSGFQTNDVLDVNAGDPTTAGNGGGRGIWAQESFLGRLNYNFSDRYIVTAAFRADGSVNFGPQNKWGYFPSISAAWRASEESFFPDNKIFSDVRLRFETGLTGSQGNSGPIYGTFAKVLPTEWGPGFRPANFANPNYQWEETKTDNFGLTLGLLENRIQVEADYYIKNTDNLILLNKLPTYMGTDGNASISAPTVNIGSLENKGFSVSVKTTNIDNGRMKWESNFNISSFKTKMTELTTGSTHITREGQDWFLNNFAQRTVVGRAPWMFFGYIEEGIFQTEDEVKNSALPVDGSGNEYPVAENSIWVGDVKYRDISGPEGVPDGKITDMDMTFIGNPWPKWFGGFTNTFSYKGFDVSVLITASYGNDVYNYLRYENSNPNAINLSRNMFVEAFDYAKVENDAEGNAYLLNPGTNVARMSSASVNGNYDRLTNKFLEDGSYVRLKNISINYNIPSALIGKQRIVRSARVGVSMQNVFTITGYSGYDPEIGSYVGPNAGVARGFVGVDYGRYPLTPVYSFNVGIDF
jgi:TonB-dependent starch-binding outer membrane protein SusC